VYVDDVHVDDHTTHLPQTPSPLRAPSQPITGVRAWAGSYVTGAECVTRPCGLWACRRGLYGSVELGCAVQIGFETLRTGAYTAWEPTTRLGPGLFPAKRILALRWFPHAATVGYWGYKLRVSRLMEAAAMVKDRYQLEPGNQEQEQGASAVVVFAYVVHGACVAQVHGGRGRVHRRAQALRACGVQLRRQGEGRGAAGQGQQRELPGALPLPGVRARRLHAGAPDDEAARHGQHTEAEYLHLLLKAVHQLHVGMVHCDLKPQNVVKVGDEDRWKLIDFATAWDDGDEVPLDYTLRYAAPEVIKAVAASAATTVRRCSSDMWSSSLDNTYLGVMAYELYTGERLFGDMSNEQVAATLAMTGEVPLPGLHNIEPNASRFIGKLLAKDPKGRWMAEKGLEARFFRHRSGRHHLLLCRGGLCTTQHRLQGGQDSGREPRDAQGHADWRPAGGDRAVGARARAAALRAE
jgi:hypothetical protein